jgi:glycosyltransferase involved in cell wall biosynthesis
MPLGRGAPPGIGQAQTMNAIATISLDRIIPLGRASISARPDAIKLETDPRQWAYSAQADLDIPAIEDEPHILKISLVVEKGVLGVGWLRADGSAWVVRGSATGNTKEVKLALPAKAPAGKLVFDNWTEGNQPAHALIKQVQVIPNDSERRYRAGLKQEQASDPAAAIALYKSALELEPSHTKALAALRRLEFLDSCQPFFNTGSESLRGEETTSRPTLAFIAWGDVFEDYFGSIGVSFDRYCTEFTGSWHIHLMDALKRRDINTVVYYSSTYPSKPVRRTHSPSGATICVTPAPKSYRLIYNRMVHPDHSFAYWSGVDALFGKVTGVRRIWFSILKNIAPYLATHLRILAQEIRADRCSAILCQEYEHVNFDKSILLGLLLGIPVFGIFQGGTRDWNRIGTFLRPLTMRLGSGFIVGPSDERERVRQSYRIRPNKIHEIFNPLDINDWTSVDRSAARAKFGISQDAQVVLWHGRVQIGEKGLDLLLDAWDRVCHERPGRPLQLALLGAGQGSPYLRDRIAALPSRDVIWIDQFVSDRQFIRLFLACGDVYAFPSRVEGFPNAPVEAMAAGLPVVAAAASGVREIFQDGENSGGIVVPVNDVAALADGLGRLLDDEDARRRLGERGRHRAKSFSLETVGAQLERVLFS